MTASYSDIVMRIKEAARIAASTPNRPEAKLRELVAPLINEHLATNQLDFDFEVRDELVLANGRPDSVYRRLILEYKKPGEIKPNNEKNRVIIAKVQGYIEDLAKKEGWKQERLLGIAFDGLMFLYIRKVRRWIVEEPVIVTPESVERFFLTLRNLVGKSALVPENLIRDFAVGAGSLNYIASNAIKAFYFALTKNVDPKVGVFFKQWANQFAEVHGAIESVVSQESHSKYL